MSTPEDELQAFCSDIEQRGAERVVVRWIDETRPVDQDEGITVEPVTRATLKTAVDDDEIIERTFEEISYDKLKGLLSDYSFETLFRSNNLTRR